MDRNGNDHRCCPSGLSGGFARGVRGLAGDGYDRSGKIALLLPDVSLIALYQDIFRSVMRVEMAIDAEFVPPAAAKELGNELKAAKAWLQGQTVALVPQSLDRDMRPIVPEQGPTASGGFPLMIEDVPRGTPWDDKKKVSCPGPLLV
jgi:hypothetical protein